MSDPDSNNKKSDLRALLIITACFAAVVILVLLFFVAIAPKHDYQTVGDYNLRTSRVTGETEVLSGGAWTPTTPPTTSTQVNGELPQAEVAKLTARTDGLVVGMLMDINLQNESNYYVRSVTVEATGYFADGRVAWKKQSQFRPVLEIVPGGSDMLIVTGDRIRVADGQRWTLVVVGATGKPAN